MSNRGFSQINPRAGYQTQPSPTGFNQLQPQKHFIESGKQPEPQQYEGYSLAFSLGLGFGWPQAKATAFAWLGSGISKPKVNKGSTTTPVRIAALVQALHTGLEFGHVILENQTLSGIITGTFSPPNSVGISTTCIYQAFDADETMHSMTYSKGEGFLTRRHIKLLQRIWHLNTLFIRSFYGPQRANPFTLILSPVSGIEVLKASNWADKMFTNERSKFLNTEMAVKMHWKGVVPDKGSVERKAYNQWQGAVYLWSACGPVVTGCPADTKSTNKLIGAAWSLPQSSGH
ncbi:hypothetical protein C8F04DRAFT_1189926 [Mycena alexandri]|uniref:Uncharacterized protein n=1 Tax=Mycena alexandri TaxID=1745969 RepID=A0AAD6SHV6_9AGAR|nr:hypothetical protein C8F04DRAFT_1189926 [Mycena alexandri]